MDRPKHFTPVRERASERRNRQLEELKSEGFPVVRVDKWQSCIGPLVIWPYSGRFFNKITGTYGKLKSLSMRTLIIRHNIRNLLSPS
jgi:hypothetical protein